VWKLGKREGGGGGGGEGDGGRPLIIPSIYLPISFSFSFIKKWFEMLPPFPFPFPFPLSLISLSLSGFSSVE